MLAGGTCYIPGEDFRARVQLETYLAGEVDLNGLNANVLRASRHDAVREMFVWGRGK